MSSSTFETWLRKLKDRQARLRILERIDRRAHGNAGDAKPVGSGVTELRLAFGPGYRVYFMRSCDVVIVLLCGGNKSTQQKDIEQAHWLAEEWRREKDTTDDRK